MLQCELTDPGRGQTGPARVPGFMVALGPDGPVGSTTNVTITETDDPQSGHPNRIMVQGRGNGIDLKMDLSVESAIVTKGERWPPVPISCSYACAIT